jgi:hypothetical protein
MSILFVLNQLVNYNYNFQGILEPCSTTQVPLIVSAQDLEELGTTVHFTIVGNPGVTLVGADILHYFVGFLQHLQLSGVFYVSLGR